MTFIIRSVFESGLSRPAPARPRVTPRWYLRAPMPYVPLPKLLFRAPLLPLRALWDGRRGLQAHRLGAAAISLASPNLAASGSAPRTAQAKLALDRYHRRAAFRPTPHGLFAGVGVGALGVRARIRTGTPTPVWRITWQRFAELGRALLEEPAVREHARLRRAPSAIIGAHAVVWLGPGDSQESADGFVEERHADLDPLLASILDHTATWTPWPAVRAVVEAVTAGGADADEADDFLARMIDDGLLHSDLVPPLVGPDPADWMDRRLAAIPAAAPCDGTTGPRARGGRTWRRTSGGGGPGRPARRNAPPRSGRHSGLDATLLFADTRASLTLPTAAVDRAAALAPLLFRLQEALSPPVAERTPAVGLADALDATTEIFGAGALDLGAFALGDYGVNPAGERRSNRARAPPVPRRPIDGCSPSCSTT